MASLYPSLARSQRIPSLGLANTRCSPTLAPQGISHNHPYSPPPYGHFHPSYTSHAQIPHPSQAQSSSHIQPPYFHPQATRSSSYGFPGQSGTPATWSLLPRPQANRIKRNKAFKQVWQDPDGDISPFKLDRSSPVKIDHNSPIKVGANSADGHFYDDRGWNGPYDDDKDGRMVVEGIKLALEQIAFSPPKAVQLPPQSLASRRGQTYDFHLQLAGEGIWDLPLNMMDTLRTAVITPREVDQNFGIDPRDTLFADTVGVNPRDTIGNIQSETRGLIRAPTPVPYTPEDERDTMGLSSAQLTPTEPANSPDCSSLMAELPSLSHSFVEPPVKQCSSPNPFSGRVLSFNTPPKYTRHQPLYMGGRLPKLAFTGREDANVVGGKANRFACSLRSPARLEKIVPLSLTPLPSPKPRKAVEKVNIDGEEDLSA